MINARIGLALLALPAATAIAATDQKPAPGEWEVRTTIKDVQFGGLSGPAAQMAGQIKAALQSQQQVVRECLTPEQAASTYGGINPGASGQCKFESFKMEEGKLTARGLCNDPEKGRMTMMIDGTYASDKVETNTDFVFAAPTGGDITIKTFVVRQRTGSCDARGPTAK